MVLNNATSLAGVVPALLHYRDDDPQHRSAEAREPLRQARWRDVMPLIRSSFDQASVA